MSPVIIESCLFGRQRPGGLWFEVNWDKKVSKPSCQQQ
jgi:hypothetical protein